MNWRRFTDRTRKDQDLAALRSRRNHIDQKPRQMALGKPIVKRGWKHQRLVDRVRDKTLAHRLHRKTGPKLSLQKEESISDTLLEAPESA